MCDLNCNHLATKFMVRASTSRTEVTDARKRCYIALVIVGLVLASCGVNAIQPAGPLPQSFAFKDDLLDFSIASYYKGANQSLTFTSTEPGLTVIQPFTYGTEVPVPEGNCVSTIVVQKESIDQVFGLCAEGTKIVKHEIDQENFKDEKPPLTLTLQTELKYPVACYDMLTTAQQSVIVALCRRTDTKVLVLIEVSVVSFKITASSDITLEGDQPDLKEPGFAVDLSPADKQLDYELILFDKQPEEFKTALRWVQRNEKTNPGAFIPWLYFGQNVATRAGKNAPLPVQLNSVKIPDIFLRNRKLFVLARNDNVASKSTKCELKASPIGDGSMDFECSDLIEIFTNTDSNSFVDIAFSPDVYSSTDEQVEIALTYVEASRFDKKNLYFPSLLAVRPVEKLFFKTNLDLKAKVPVIGVSGREVLIHATDEKSNTFLMHWKIEREYLSVVKDTPLRFKSLFARQAPIDRRKLEIIYFSDSQPSNLNHFTVQGTEFKISPSDPAFDGKDRVQLSFKVTDGDKTLEPLLSLSILRDLEKDASLSLNEAYDMYPGTRASIPVSSDRIAGNGATFSISTNNNNVTASVKYAEMIGTPKWPTFSTGVDAEITFAKNIGSNTYLVSSGTYLKAFTCNYDGDKLNCDPLFENQQSGDFQIIDAKKHDENVFILFKRTETDMDEPTVGIMTLVLKDGTESYTPVLYKDLLGNGALGVIRVLNQQVYIDIIARTAQEKSKQKILLAKFKASQTPPATLKPRDSLPPHVCPTAMFWSPRHEPYLFIESVCDGKKEVLEFYENFDDIKNFALEKIYPMSATSKNQMCITSAAIVIIDFESSEIFGLLRGPSQSSKIAFPFKALGYTAPKSVGCSRYNNFFQVVATSTADNRDYLITYRTNSANQPNKRIHSIVELATHQGGAQAKQWVLPSVNPAYQEIFTITLGAKWSDAKQAAVVELDVPRIKVNLREYLQSNGEVDVTVTQKVLKSSTPVESKFKIKVREISNDLSLVPRVEGQNKVTFEKGQKSLNLDDSFYISGLVLNQTLVGDKDTVNKFKLTPRVTMNPGKYLDITTPVKDCRHSQFGVLFCWDAKHVYVWENGKKRESPFNGVYVSNADIIQGYLDPNDTKSGYTYLTGLTNMPGDQEDYLFVIKKNADGDWSYYSTAVSDGITWMRSHLIDDKEGRFAFVAHNPETDSIEVGLYTLDTAPKSYKINFVNNKTRIVKVFPDKISHVQSLYIGQTLEIIYHPRNTRDFFMIGIKSDDLSTLYEEKINFGNTPTTDSYAEGQLKCTSSYSPKKVLPSNPAQDNDVRFFCSMTTQRYGSVAAAFQLDQTKKNNPKLIDAKVIPNIPGFYPVGLRINNGYTAIIKKAIPGYPKALFPKYLADEALLVHVIVNSDQNPNSHAVIAGSVIYQSIKPEDLAAAEFGIDIGVENNSTVLILTGLNNGATIGTVSAQLNALALEIKSADADIKNVKLQIKGLEVEQLVELANHVEYEGTKFLRIVMLAVGVAFLTLICCALSFFCCNRSKAASEIAEKEVTFIDEIDRSRFSAAYSASSGSPTKQSA